MAIDSSSISPAEGSKEFTSFASAINLLTVVPSGMSAAFGRACRRIRINSVGASPTLTVKYANGCTDTWNNLVANEIFDAQIVEITSASNTNSVTVLW